MPRITTTDETKAQIHALLPNPDAKLYFHSAGDCDSYEVLAVSMDGHISSVTEYTVDRWDLLLIALAGAAKPVALIEQGDLYDLRSALHSLIKNGFSTSEAIACLLD